MSSLFNAVKRPDRVYGVFRRGYIHAFGKTDYQRFLILTRSRTGSTLLQSLLNSHPNVAADGEVFSRLNGQDYHDVLARVYCKQPQQIQAKGFKIFYYHPIDDKHGGLWQTLTDMEDLSVIHLKRQNILRTYVSRKIAGIQGVWAAGSADRRPTSQAKAVVFNATELESGFNKTRRMEREGDEMFRNHRLLQVTYEDLVNNTNITFSTITAILGVEYMQPTTDRVKQNPENLRDLILNYDELKSAFSGTEWQPFFDE